MTGTVLAGRTLYAQRQPVNARIAMASVHALLPESLVSADLGTLATSAVDAARSAGASYADARVSEMHRYELYLSVGALTAGVGLDTVFNYGLRVIVDGAPAFVHGTVPSVAAIAAAARQAVAVARSYSRLVRYPVELMPMPAARGEWHTPIQIDPFAVPLQDQVALMQAYQQASIRVRDGRPDSVVFSWQRDTRVFASSDGALATQTLWRSTPSLLPGGECGMGRVMLSLPQTKWPCSGGYETVAIPGLQDAIKQQTEEAVSFASLPRRALDVGRYPVVLDGSSLGAAFSQTVGPALELDRVLGYEVDAAGSSFLSPPERHVGTTIVSPLLSVMAHRDMPSVTAVKWDDEGAEPRATTVIRNGQLLGYCGSRQTISALHAANRSTGGAQPFDGNVPGCAVTSDMDKPTLIRTPALHVAANPQRTGVEDLIKDMRHGLVMRECTTLSTDQQFTTGLLTRRQGLMLEVVRGKVVGRVENNGLQFRTQSFWKSLQALGDADTVEGSAVVIYKGQPWQAALHSAMAPAGLFKDVYVIATEGGL